MNLPHRSRCRPGSCGARRCHRRQGCRAFPAGSCRPFSAARCSPPNLCAALRCGAAHNRPLQWYFSWKTSSFFISIQEISSGRGGNISCFEIIIRAIPYKMRFKNGSSILPFLRYTTKTAHDIFLSWAYGGKKGIRTLEGFRGPTRFPVVRLRPAQPSFHIFSCAAPDCMSYYSNTNFKCQALFCIFLQKNLRWARCMQNVRANCIFCTFCPLANGGARC